MSNDSTKKPKDIEPQNVMFHYIKSPHFRTIHVDGVYGGMTPQGKLSVSCFNERFPIPQQVTVPVIEDGKLDNANEKPEVQRSGIVRELEANLVMDVDQAEALLRWLNGKVDALKKAIENSKPKPSAGKAKKR